jgi:hypothetical protein
MKKDFLMKALVGLFTVVALCSCKKHDNDEPTSMVANNTITAKVENGGRYNIDEVAAEIEYETSSSPYYDFYVVASSDYDSDGFSLKLEETVKNKYLQLSFVDEEDVPDEVTVSNFNAKAGLAYIYAYRSKSFVGIFYYATGTSSSDWIAQLVYVNGDVSITGSYTGTVSFIENGKVTETYDYPITYNVHVKKGWNMMYEKDTDDEYELTTNVPSGLRWYYEPYSSSSSSSSAVESLKGPGLKKTLPLFNRLKNDKIIKNIKEK